jgi:hypothetical protein
VNYTPSGYRRVQDCPDTEFSLVNIDHSNRAERRAEASDERRARPRGGRRYLSTASVCERYGGINPRTVARWIKSGHLPPPMKVNGRDYHDEADLDAADAAARADILASA